MADISFIRVYPLGSGIMVDILYKSGRLHSMGLEDMPMTARKWIVDKKSVHQYDKILKSWEYVYK